ncbi:hypothetical protein Z969_09860 [Clostridium novyi A str. 4570]|uniref:Transcriptional regulator n=1 Tax=Clostridium novyi A str. 4570 TaxID=1444290 RepID=A0AA88ZLL3_CLONO|nr:transcriptional regulator [Clostridium novyi]KGN00530.1 hypothetical protein Z969_09860 [Clostridium novyi A str. 4570]
MGKVSNAIKMLILLRSRGKMKIKEIAEILEVNERSIRMYKDELEQAQIYINSTSGKYGGYELDTDTFIPNLKLTEKEYKALNMAKDFLESNNFVLLKEYITALDKINCNRRCNEFVNLSHYNYFISNNKLNYNLENEKKIWIDMNSSIICKNKVKLKYRSSNNLVKERVVHPYTIFQYKSAIYLLAYCEYRKEIRYFKLSRIEKYIILKENFKVDQELNCQIDSNCLGIFEGKQINLKLEIKYPIAQTIKERIWGKNQVITENKSNNSIIFEATMKDTEETKTWILGMGSSAVVLEPNEFVDKIKNELQQIIKLYK